MLGPVSGSANRQRQTLTLVVDSTNSIDIDKALALSLTHIDSFPDRLYEWLSLMDGTDQVGWTGLTKSDTPTM